jgi:hypothetical protein
MDPDSSEYGMFVRFEVPPEEGCFDPQNKLWWDRELDKPISTHTPGADPYFLGEFKLDDGTPVKPAFQLLVDRVKARNTPPSGQPALPVFPSRLSSVWRTKWPSPRAMKKSNCLSPGPIPGATNTSR